jgi:peptide/nickel transport system ATP-binding protein
VIEKPLRSQALTLVTAVPRLDPTLRIESVPPRFRLVDPANPPDGCYLHPRYPFGTEHCKVERRPLRGVAPGRMPCQRAKELDLARMAL